MGENKTVVRVQKNRENPYVMINKNVFTDARLSWKAKGLMGYFLSKPDDWRILVCDLIKQSTDGERAVRSGLKELEEYGYLENYPVKDARGRITHWEKVVHECPIEPDRQNSNVESEPDRRFVHVENADVENVHVENAVLLNTDTTNKRDIQNNDDNNNNGVAVVRVQIEQALGTSIPSLLPLLAEWIETYGAQALIDKARQIRNKPNTRDIIALYRKAVTDPFWDMKNEAIATSEVKQDERYASFYQLFPDA